MLAQQQVRHRHGAHGTRAVPPLQGLGSGLDVEQRAQHLVLDLHREQVGLEAVEGGHLLHRISGQVAAGSLNLSDAGSHATAGLCLLQHLLAAEARGLHIGHVVRRHTQAGGGGVHSRKCNGRDGVHVRPLVCSIGR